MIARSYILENLRMLDAKYRKAATLKESLFYSKLAVLELCGWIEESMDDVVIKCARRHLKDHKNLKFIESQVVEKTYGFDYHVHFRQMLIKTLGIINVERIEKNVDEGKRTKLVATLVVLKEARNPEAHTHIKGTTRRINAPSVTLNQFADVYDGLIAIDSFLRSTKF
jgi:hypothetical protein